MGVYTLSSLNGVVDLLSWNTVRYLCANKLFINNNTINTLPLTPGICGRTAQAGTICVSGCPVPPGGWGGGTGWGVGCGVGGSGKPASRGSVLNSALLGKYICKQFLRTLALTVWWDRGELKLIILDMYSSTGWKFSAGSWIFFIHVLRP